MVRLDRLGKIIVYILWGTATMLQFFLHLASMVYLVFDTGCSVLIHYIPRQKRCEIIMFVICQLYFYAIGDLLRDYLAESTCGNPHYILPLPLKDIPILEQFQYQA